MAAVALQLRDRSDPATTAMVAEKIIALANSAAARPQPVYVPDVRPPPYGSPGGGFTPLPEEIVAKLRQVDVLVSQGQTMVDAIRQIGVSEVTYYRWRQDFGGLKIEQSYGRKLVTA
jgi:hypothetical protein